MPRRSRYGRVGRRGHPFGSTVHHKVSSPTLRCSVHVSGISDVSDVHPDVSIAWRPGAYQSKSLAMRVVFLVLFCCARMARSCSINRPSNLGRAFYLHVDTCYKRTGRSLRTPIGGQTNDKDDKRQKRVASRHYVLRGVCRLSRI
jgi:hypothetical protein